DWVEFRITVSNFGTTDTFGNVTVTDQLSPVFEVDSEGIVTPPQNGDFDETNNLATFTTSSIQEGSSVSFYIRARAKVLIDGTVSNTATVTGGGVPTPKSSTVTLNTKPGFAPFSCAPGGTKLCLFTAGSSGGARGPALLGAETTGRFQVRVYWRAVHQGTSGQGQAVPLTSDTGYFWFFSANNIELVIKVVDGRPVNGKFWVFYGALTNVEYIIEVVDSVTGAVRGYFSRQD